MPDLQEPTPQQPIPLLELTAPPHATDMPKCVKPALREAALVRYLSGETKSAIARALGIDRKTVYTWIDQSQIPQHIEHGRARVAQMIPRSCEVLHTRLGKGSETAALAVLRGTGVLRNEDKVDMRGAFLFATDLPQELLSRYDAPASADTPQEAPQNASAGSHSDECAPVEARCLPEVSTTGKHNGSYATGTTSQVSDSATHAEERTSHERVLPEVSTIGNDCVPAPIATADMPTTAPAKRRPGTPRKPRLDNAKS